MHTKEDVRKLVKVAERYGYAAYACAGLVVAQAVGVVYCGVKTLKDTRDLMADPTSSGVSKVARDVAIGSTLLISMVPTADAALDLSEKALFISATADLTEDSIVARTN